MNLNIAICDDGQLALDNEAAIIHDVLEEKQIEHAISCFRTSHELLSNGDLYNIVFLDDAFKYCMCNAVCCSGQNCLAA